MPDSDKIIHLLTQNPKVVFLKRLAWLALFFGLMLFSFSLVNQFRGLAFDGQTAMTFLVVGDSRMSLVSLHPNEQKLVVMALPAQMYVKISDDVGYTVESLWRYGKSKGDPFLNLYLPMSRYLGVFIDGYFYDPEWKEGAPTIDNRYLRSIKTRSSFKIIDRYKIIETVNSYKDSQRHEIVLTESMFEKVTQPDGVIWWKINPDSLDDKVSELISDTLILSDRRAVVINNASGVSGVAREFERLAKNVGLVVVEIKETPVEDGECRVVYSGEETGVVSWLSSKFSCKMEKTENTNRRGEIEVFLAKKWLSI